MGAEFIVNEWGHKKLRMLRAIDSGLEVDTASMVFLTLVAQRLVYDSGRCYGLTADGECWLRYWQDRGYI